MLAALRKLIPNRPMTFNEALRIAELQANHLRELLSVDDDAFPTELIEELSRLRVVERPNFACIGCQLLDAGRLDHRAQ